MITIIDAIMGTGKSTYLINMVNSHPKNKYLIVVPFLSEVKRYQESIKSIHFIEPNNWGHSKSEHLLKLLSEGENVITTHQLILRANIKIQEILKEEGYTLLLDEALNVFNSIGVPKDDVDLLKENGIIYFNDDQQVIWNNEIAVAEKYKHGAFENLKELVTSGKVYYPYYNQCRDLKMVTFIWNFQPEFFNCFKESYIATYLWNCNFQKFYFDFYNVKYEHKSLISNQLVKYAVDYEKPVKQTFRDMVTVLDDPKMNRIGDKVGKSCPLSQGWFANKANDSEIKQLQKNIYNFFRNKIKCKSEDRMWTTYKAHQSKLKGKGYSGSDKNVCFVPLGSKCTNDYSHKTVLVFAANLYMEPFLKYFFVQNKLPIPENEYALSEMIQWIWRSAIRNGKHIDIYIPSERMRNLFNDWLYES